MNLDSLTRIERIVFDQLVLGKSNEEIGKTIATAEKTVKGRMTHIMQKLGCTTRTQVVAAYYLGVIDEITNQPSCALGGSKAGNGHPLGSSDTQAEALIRDAQAVVRRSWEA